MDTASNSEDQDWGPIYVAGQGYVMPEQPSHEELQKLREGARAWTAQQNGKVAVIWPEGGPMFLYPPRPDGQPVVLPEDMAVYQGQHQPSASVAGQSHAIDLETPANKQQSSSPVASGSGMRYKAPGPFPNSGPQISHPAAVDRKHANGENYPRLPAPETHTPLTPEPESLSAPPEAKNQSRPVACGEATTKIRMSGTAEHIREKLRQKLLEAQAEEKQKEELRQKKALEAEEEQRRHMKESPYKSGSSKTVEQVRYELRQKLLRAQEERDRLESSMLHVPETMNSRISPEVASFSRHETFREAPPTYSSCQKTTERTKEELQQKISTAQEEEEDLYEGPKSARVPDNSPVTPDTVPNENCKFTGWSMERSIPASMKPAEEVLKNTQPTGCNSGESLREAHRGRLSGITAPHMTCETTTQPHQPQGKISIKQTAPKASGSPESTMKKPQVSILPSHACGSSPKYLECSLKKGSSPSESHKESRFSLKASVAGQATCVSQPGVQDLRRGEADFTRSVDKGIPQHLQRAPGQLNANIGRSILQHQEDRGHTLHPSGYMRNGPEQKILTSQKPSRTHGLPTQDQKSDYNYLLQRAQAQIHQAKEGPELSDRATSKKSKEPVTRTAATQNARTGYYSLPPLPGSIRKTNETASKFKKSMWSMQHMGAEEVWDSHRRAAGNRTVNFPRAGCHSSTRNTLIPPMIFGAEAYQGFNDEQMVWGTALAADDQRVGPAPNIQAIAPPKSTFGPRPPEAARQQSQDRETCAARDEELLRRLEVAEEFRANQGFRARKAVEEQAMSRGQQAFNNPHPCATPNTAGRNHIEWLLPHETHDPRAARATGTREAQWLQKRAHELKAQAKATQHPILSDSVSIEPISDANLWSAGNHMVRLTAAQDFHTAQKALAIWAEGKEHRATASSNNATLSHAASCGPSMEQRCPQSLSKSRPECRTSEIQHVLPKVATAQAQEDAENAPCLSASTSRITTRTPQDAEPNTPAPSSFPEAEGPENTDRTKPSPNTSTNDPNPRLPNIPLPVAALFPEQNTQSVTEPTCNRSLEILGDIDLDSWSWENVKPELDIFIVTRSSEDEWELIEEVVTHGSK